MPSILLDINFNGKCEMISRLSSQNGSTLFKMAQIVLLEPSTCNMHHTGPVPQHIASGVSDSGPGWAAGTCSIITIWKRTRPIFNDLHWPNHQDSLCSWSLQPWIQLAPHPAYLSRGARPNFVGDSLRAKSCSTLQGSKTVIHPEIHVNCELFKKEFTTLLQHLEYGHTASGRCLQKGNPSTPW